MQPAPPRAAFWKVFAEVADDTARATVKGVVPDAAAEEAIARLVRLADLDADGGGIDVVVAQIEDGEDDVEPSVSLRADVPADKAPASRAALTESVGEPVEGDGEVRI